MGKSSWLRLVRVCIVGAGAIGLVFAEILGKEHELVLLCRREAQVELISPMFNATTKLDEVGKVDVFLLATKAYDAHQALSSLRRVFPTTPTVCIQNGLIVFEDENVIRGVTTYAATRKSDSESILVAEGELILEDSAQARRITREFNQAGLKTKIAEDMGKVLWEKFFINVGINALGAVANVRNGELVRDPSLRRRMKKIVKEAVVVSGTGRSPKEVFRKVVETATKTSKNKNSMLQDIEAGRKTEIDFLNGAVCALGELSGISTPENKRVTAQIKQLEALSK